MNNCGINTYPRLTALNNQIANLLKTNAELKSTVDELADESFLNYLDLSAANSVVEVLQAELDSYKFAAEALDGERDHLNLKIRQLESMLREKEHEANIAKYELRMVRRLLAEERVELADTKVKLREAEAGILRPLRKVRKPVDTGSLDLFH